MKIILLFGVLFFSIAALGQQSKKDTLTASDFLQLKGVPHENVAVVIDIVIDTSGNTISATFHPKGSTTSDSSIIHTALFNALKMKWENSKASVKKRITLNYTIVGI